MGNWHYNAGGVSTGPVSLDDLIGLYKTGKINENTLVWNAEKAGEWAKYRSYPELNDTAAPPPLPATAINDTWIWIIAFAPLIGLLIESIYASNAGSFLDDKVILIAYWVAYVFLASLDLGAIRKSGRRQQVGSIGPLILLVPVYIFMRSRRLEKPQYPLLVWIAGIVVSAMYPASDLAGQFYFAAGRPACESTTSVAQVKGIFPDIPLNIGKLPAQEVTSIETVSKTETMSTCKATVVVPSGASVPISFTITDSGSNYQYYVSLTF